MRIDTHEILKGRASFSAFNCEGGLAYSVTPPQLITGDDQHLFSYKEKKGKENLRRIWKAAMNSSEGS